jgi:hypothetical protein
MKKSELRQIIKEEIQKEMFGLEEYIILEIGAPNVAALAAAQAAAQSVGTAGQETSNPWPFLALAVITAASPWVIPMLSDVRPVQYIRDWVKRYKLNRVIDRLRKDPEVLEFIKTKKPGIQNFLKTKLSPEEQKYITNISWNKITKGEIREFNNKK